MNTKGVRLSVWMLPFVMTFAVWLDARRLLSFTAGGMYFVLAGGLSFAGLLALDVAGYSAPRSGWISKLSKTSGGVRAVVVFAYCVLTLSGLNSWVPASQETARSWLIAAAICYLFTALLTMLARTPIVSDLRVAESATGVKYALQVTTARLLTIGTALPVALALAVVVRRAQSQNWAIPASLSAPGVALLYAAMCSLCFAFISFSPASLGRVARAYLRGCILVASAVLIFQAVLEFIVRKNWYLYGLSSATFLATCLVFSRCWAELSSAKHEPGVNDSGLSTKAATTGCTG